MEHKIAIDIRAKKLGVLIRDARLEAGESMKACGEVLGTSGYMISQYEQGNKSPTLPQLEVLAYFLDVPMERFWGQEIHSDLEPIDELEQVTERIQLRHRIIGANLRKAREEAGLSLTEVADLLDITTYRLKSYEVGKLELPLPELEALLSIYNLPLEEFRDKKGVIGEWATEKHAVSLFLDLGPEMQQFVVKPRNKPYLKVARKLSHLSAEELRAVAEGLLEITL